MFQSISKAPQSEDFNLAASLLAAGPIGHHARKGRNFGEPAPVFFLLKLDPWHNNSLLDHAITS